MIETSRINTNENEKILSIKRNLARMLTVASVLIPQLLSTQVVNSQEISGNQLFSSNNIVEINNHQENEVGAGGSYLVLVDPALYENLEENPIFNEWLDYLDENTLDAISLDSSQDWSELQPMEMRNYLQNANSELNFRAPIIIDPEFVLPYEQYLTTSRTEIRQTVSPYTDLNAERYEKYGEMHDERGRQTFIFDVSERISYPINNFATNLLYILPEFDSSDELLNYLTEVTRVTATARNDISLNSTRLTLTADRLISEEDNTNQEETLLENGFNINDNLFNIPLDSERDHLINSIMNPTDILLMSAHGNENGFYPISDSPIFIDDFENSPNYPIRIIIATSCSIARESNTSNLGIAGELVSNGLALQVNAYPTLLMSVQSHKNNLTPASTGINVQDNPFLISNSPLNIGSPVFIESGTLGEVFNRSMNIQSGTSFNAIELITAVNPDAEIIDYHVFTTNYVISSNSAGSVTRANAINEDGENFTVSYFENSENRVVLRAILRNQDEISQIVTYEINVTE